MQATVNVRNEAQKLNENYLGYAIQAGDGYYMAIPEGWRGEMILAESMPQLRRKIWRFWFQVQ